MSAIVLPEKWSTAHENQLPHFLESEQFKQTNGSADHLVLMIERRRYDVLARFLGDGFLIKSFLRELSCAESGSLRALDILVGELF